MIIIGVDFHPEFQQIAWVDTGTGELQERRLQHREEGESFYRDLAGRAVPVRVGVEASGHARWFERLMSKLQFELWIGNAAEIRTKRVRKQKTVRPAAARAGIQKHIGWHTFRHSFSTMLMANGENVKVVQELMRHANCRCTLEIYSQARLQAKREAQHRVVELIMPRQSEATETELPLILANGEAAKIELS